MTDDEAVIDVYLEMRRAGMGERQAARRLGTTHREIAAYADMNPEFAMRLEDALLERLEAVEHKVWEAGQAGDMTAAKQVLESHAPAEWTKPTPEMILRVQQVDADIDVGDLKARLEAAQRKIELDRVAIEVDSDE